MSKVRDQQSGPAYGSTASFIQTKLKKFMMTNVPTLVAGRIHGSDDDSDAAIDLPTSELKALPNIIKHECCQFIADVAIVLKDGQSGATAENLANSLTVRKPGLSARVCSLRKCNAVLLSASTNGLLQWAEDFRLVKRERHTGHLRTFLISQFEHFENSDVPNQFFTRPERQQLIQLAVESVRTVGKYEIYGEKRLRRGQSVLAHLKASGIVSSFFPLHSEEELKRLRSKWVTKSVFDTDLPIDDICLYFDSSIAFYFAWLHFYTMWLFLPAVFGLLIWLFQPTFFNVEEKTSQVQNSSIVVVLIAFNTIWFAFYQKFWKRRSSELAFRWGAIDHRESSDHYLAEPRPLFTGRSAVNPVTGKPTLHWPSWRRTVTKYLVSFPVTLACLWLMMWAVLLCLRLDKYTYQQTKDWPAPANTFIILLPLMLYVFVLNFFNNIYMTVAIHLNDLENHFSQNDYVKQLQAKLIVFRFFNSFLPLFYTAFYEKDFQSLQDQVAALVMIRQVASNAYELLLPYLMSRYQQSQLSVDGNNKDRTEKISKKIKKKQEKKERSVVSNLQQFLQVRPNRRASSYTLATATLDKPENEDPETKQSLLRQVQNECLLQEFDDCFEDYLEMFCQLGYIMLFSVACPPVAFWCLLNNLVEVKTDALKMCTATQRPFARERVRDIGVWTKAFDMLAVAAIAVNVALVACFDVGTDFFPTSTVNRPYAALLGIVVVEHIIFLLRALANHFVDDVPSWVHMEVAKREYTLLTQPMTPKTTPKRSA